MGNETQLTSKNQRFKFIDAARSIAILLMLEGHFITLTLDTSSFDNESNIYATWRFIKGFTAPLFFSITGIILVYLLCKYKDQEFFKITRVKKGFKRAIKLLFWGYLLQLNILYFNEYLALNFDSWCFAFHVLQCIALGMIVCLLIFGLFKVIHRGKLYIYYLIAGTIVFLFYPLMKSLPPETYFPKNSPEIIQNIFKGPYSVFPIVPWIGFVLYGGAVGAFVSHYKKRIESNFFCILFILAGSALHFVPWQILSVIDWLFNTSIVMSAGLIARFGQVLILLGILIFLTRSFKKSDSLFLRIGQNTLSIYIIHVIILYSGIFGIGLDKVLKNTLTPLESIFGAICFIAFFVLFTHHYHFFKNKWIWLKRAPYKLLFSKLIKKH